MGSWKNYQLEYQEEDEIRGFVQQLLDAGHLTHKTEIAIAEKVAHEGIDSLSEERRAGRPLSQKEVFEKYVLSHAIENCTRCSSEIPWSEKFEAIGNGGYCGLCLHKMNKGE